MMCHALCCILLLITFSISLLVVAQDQPLAKGPAFQSSNDEAGVRDVIKGLSECYAKKNAEAFGSLWSNKSPNLATAKQRFITQLSRYERIEIKKTTVSNLRIDGKEAAGRLVMEIEVKDGKPATSLATWNRDLRFVREDGKWKLLQEEVSEEVLARVIVDAKTEGERSELLEHEPKLQTVELRKALVWFGYDIGTRRDSAHGVAILEFAKKLAEKIDDRDGIAAALNNLGLVYYPQGNYDLAIRAHKHALEIGRELRDPSRIANPLMNLARIDRKLGKYEQAIAKLTEASLVLEGWGNNQDIAAVKSTLADVYSARGDYSEALENYTESLAVFEALCKKAMKASDARGTRVAQIQIASQLHSIGLVYYRQGNYDQALEHYRESLALKQRLGIDSEKAKTLGNIGLVHYSKRDYGEARKSFQETLELSEKADDHALIANATGNLGLVHFMLGDYDQALESFTKSHGLQQDEATKALMLNNIGVVHNAKGSYEKALAFSGDATRIARLIGNRDVLWQALSSAGAALRALNRKEHAREHFDQAIVVVEELRSRVAGPEQERRHLLQDRLFPYQAMVDLMIAEERPAEALVYAERAKARVLLDVLQSGKANITRAITVEEREGERRLSDELVSLRRRQTNLENARSAADQALLMEAKARLEEKQHEYDAFQTRLYASHPELRTQRGQARVVTAEEAASLMPNPQSALLEYVVTDNRTYLFVITPGKPSHTLKTYELEVNAKNLTGLVEQFRKQLADRNQGFQKVSREIYDRLLSPAREQLRGKTDVIIVPDSILWELPFQALRSAENRYLIEDAAVSYAPSLTVLREVMKLRKNRPKSGLTSTLFAMGNPSLGRSATDRANLVLEGESLIPIPETEKQVKDLRKLYGPARSRVYFGTYAREDRLKAEAGKFDVVHLATHGLLNNKSPLNSCVVLSQTGNRAGDDGLLEAREIMKLDLKADLVVLSACETGRGQISPGEGLIGLSWSLFVAGSPTAVVSQWKVQEDSTIRLMLEFHKNLKGNNERVRPMSKAAALREAALKLMRSVEYRHPFYWAGFVVVGDGG